MSRNRLAAAALLLGLAAAVPAYAQSSPALAGVPEDSTAARTLAQNRRAVFGPPVSGSGNQATAQPAAAQQGRPAGAGQPAAGRRVALAEKAAVR